MKVKEDQIFFPSRALPSLTSGMAWNGEHVLVSRSEWIPCHGETEREEQKKRESCKTFYPSLRNKERHVILVMQWRESDSQDDLITPDAACDSRPLLTTDFCATG